jgi:phage/plasmid-associated DNA primase
MIKIIYREYHDFPFEVGELDPKKKTFKNHRLTHLLYIPYTDEAWKECQKWNKKLREWIEYDYEFRHTMEKIGFYK